MRMRVKQTDGIATEERWLLQKNNQIVNHAAVCLAIPELIHALFD
jgi:hypothetical protein